MISRDPFSWPLVLEKVILAFRSIQPGRNEFYSRSGAPAKLISHLKYRSISESHYHEKGSRSIRENLATKVPVVKATECTTGNRGPPIGFYSTGNLPQTIQPIIPRGFMLLKMGNGNLLQVSGGPKHRPISKDSTHFSKIFNPKREISPGWGYIPINGFIPLPACGLQFIGQNSLRMRLRERGPVSITPARSKMAASA